MAGAKYLVTLTGTQPLIMHRDNVEWSDTIKAWQQDPNNKKLSKAGDDRSPAWTWLGSLYHDDRVIAISADNIMTMLREGGASVPVPGGKNGKTFKSQSQSGILPLDPFWPVLVPQKDGKREVYTEIPVEPLAALEGNADFEKHAETVRDVGFELFVKRVKVGTSKHIRVRPMFRRWTAAGSILVTDTQITRQVLVSILDMAGKLKGLCDWRPSSKTPGPYGTFEATVEEV